MHTVQDVMTQPAISVAPDATIREVARALVDRGVSGLPVVDAGGRVVGVVSEGDLLVKGVGAEQVPHRPLARLFGESRETQEAIARIEARTAGEAMTSPAVTIEATASLRAAASLMTEHGIKRLPVVTGDRLVGIVTRADLVRAWLRSDDELAAAVREEALVRQLWLDPADFTVMVNGGVVSIRGHVTRRSTALMVPRYVRAVPGVIDVEADVDWEIDDGEIEAPDKDLIGRYEP
jgi:CBS domain-containing protein